MAFNFTATEMNSIAKESNDKNNRPEYQIVDLIIRRMGDVISAGAKSGKTQASFEKKLFPNIIKDFTGKTYTTDKIDSLINVVVAKIKNSTDFYIANYSDILFIAWSDFEIELTRISKGMKMYNGMMTRFKKNMNIIIDSDEKIVDTTSGTIYEKCNYPVENGLAKMKKKLSYVFKHKHYDKEFRLIKMTYHGNSLEAMVSDHTSYDLKNYRNFTFYKPINSWSRSLTNEKQLV
jgi:hypothetical protein